MNACEDRSIDPFEKDGGKFSVYGVLDMNKETNFIRIKDLSKEFEPGINKELNAQVILENLNNGNKVQLRDSVIKLSGFYTHNFVFEEQIEPESIYELSIESSDGRSLKTLAFTPQITEAVVIPDANVQCFRFVEFTFKNVVRPERIRMEVGFFFQGQIVWGDIGKLVELRYDIEGKDEMFVQARPKDLLIEVFPPPGLGDPRVDQNNLQPVFLCNTLDSPYALVRYTHLSREWENFKLDTETGQFDPTQSIDVPGGLGFFGAVFQDTTCFFMSMKTGGCEVSEALESFR